MQLVILAGGLGSRISEETRNKPQPLGNMWQTNYCSYHGTLCQFWGERIHHLLWI